MDFHLSCIFGSGTKAGVIEINGQYPAAPIQVTEGALVHVKVNNNLFGAVAPTLHWHGFKMSKGYYWYVMPGAKVDGHSSKLTLTSVKNGRSLRIILFGRSRIDFRKPHTFSFCTI